MVEGAAPREIHGAAGALGGGDEGVLHQAVLPCYLGLCNHGFRADFRHDMGDDRFGAADDDRKVGANRLQSSA